MRWARESPRPRRPLAKARDLEAARYCAKRLRLQRLRAFGCVGDGCQMRSCSISTSPGSTTSGSMAIPVIFLLAGHGDADSASSGGAFDIVAANSCWALREHLLGSCERIGGTGAAHTLSSSATTAAAKVPVVATALRHDLLLRHRRGADSTSPSPRDGHPSMVFALHSLHRGRPGASSSRIGRPRMTSPAAPSPPGHLIRPFAVERIVKAEFEFFGFDRNHFA